MMAKGAKAAASSRSEDRRRRVALELRANLLKRKEQARARAVGERAVAREREKPTR